MYQEDDSSKDKATILRFIFACMQTYVSQYHIPIIWKIQNWSGRQSFFNFITAVESVEISFEIKKNGSNILHSNIVGSLLGLFPLHLYRFTISKFFLGSIKSVTTIRRPFNNKSLVINTMISMMFIMWIDSNNNCGSA